MTSNEIRAQSFNDNTIDHVRFALYMLQELTAQVAELKELLDSGKNGQANILAWNGDFNGLK